MDSKHNPLADYYYNRRHCTRPGHVPLRFREDDMKRAVFFGSFASMIFMAAEVGRWGKLVREANIKAD